MKLIFVGTSHGVPEKDRRCSSYLLEVGGSYYIIDMGTQTIEDPRRREIAIEDVRLVICTHPHGDHTDGLVSFVDLLNWYYKQAQTKILLPDERLIPLLREWAQISDNGKPFDPLAKKDPDVTLPSEERPSAAVVGARMRGKL